MAAGPLGGLSPAPGSPRALPGPRVPLDELAARLRTLGTAGDVTTIRTGLGTVIAGLQAQVVLVGDDFAPTYVWLLAKLGVLRDACTERGGTGNVVRAVNVLATELADALGSAGADHDESGHCHGGNG